MAADTSGAPNFERFTLSGVLGTELDALSDAQGDVIGATEGLRLPQQKLVRAEEVLDVRTRELIQGLAELNLVGNAIHFDAGTSRGSLDRASLTKQFFVNGDTKRDLTDTAGVILSAEVGTVLGVPIAKDDQVVFHVYVPPEFPQNQIVVADETIYSILRPAPAAGE